MNVSPPFLNLTVLRSPDIERAAKFYSEIGLVFTKHRHGKGPEHYSFSANGVVFEIYPLENHPPTLGARIGFSVENVDLIVPRLIAMGAEQISSPADSPWGRRAVLIDLDGHTVELLEPSSHDNDVYR